MLAVAGGKGGVGKTTTVLGLAGALPGTPLAVDADTEMPDLHALAGVARKPGLDEVVNGGSSPLGRRCDDHDCRVLPASTGDAPRTDRLLARLREQRAGDEVVLVDTPAGASVDAAAPLRAADGVLVVSTAARPALRDAAKTASMARAVGSRVVGVLLTRTATQPTGVEELLGAPVVGCVPEKRGRPLSAPGVRDRYEAAAARLGPAAAGQSPERADSCTEPF